MEEERSSRPRYRSESRRDADRGSRRMTGSQPPVSQSRPKTQRTRTKSNPAAGWRPQFNNVVWQTAGRTALSAGTKAAFQMKDQPGPWVGEKGAKVASAAFTAALVDSFVSSRHPERAEGMRHKTARKAADTAIGTAAARSVRR